MYRKFSFTVLNMTSKFLRIDIITVKGVRTKFPKYSTTILTTANCTTEMKIENSM
jgi:hypothetical protein